jgi:hypothetical protein
MKKIFFFVIMVSIFLPATTFAQKYLVDLGVNLENKDTFNEYINLLYVTSISVAALLAVVKIVIAGAKYMLSDVVTNKSDAKKDIKGALLGLLLIIGAVIILNTINPALTDGGLNITKIKRVPLSISAPSVRATGGQAIDQIANDIATAIGPCAKTLFQTPSAGGTKMTTRTDISTCTDKAAAVSAAKTACLKTAGATFAAGPNNEWVGCATPLAKPALNNYCENGADGPSPIFIDPSLVKKVGNIYTIDSSKVASANKDLYWDKFKDYCEHQYGKFANSTSASAEWKCTLPISTEDAPFDGIGESNAELLELDAWRNSCTQSGGELRDGGDCGLIDLNLDEVCAKY